MAHLISGFAGDLIGPDHPAYERARRVHNGLIDRRPALIARCAGPADVVDAIGYARSQGLPLAIRGGGHNVAGRSTVDGGVVVDLSGMKGIHVSRRERTARAEAGLTWAGFNRETQAHALATTGGVVSTTGIAGLTLGGGIGYLMGRHGLTIDNLLSAEVVTADGRIVTASADEHPDLYWALRGGGGNFGVVTSFEFRLHPVGPMVTGGLVVHPIDRGADVLRFYRDAAAGAAEDLTIFAALTHAPDGSRIAGLVCGHCGTLADGEAAMAPLKRFGPPLLDTIGPIPYTGLNAMLDAANPAGALNYWKTSFLNELTDESIDVMVRCFEQVPRSLSAIMLEYVPARVAAVGITETAYPHRRRGFNLVVIGQWLDPASTEAAIRWTRESYAALQPFTAARSYVNYQSDEDGSAVEAAYGPNHARLRQVKAAYDPQNVFRLNQNILPAGV